MAEMTRRDVVESQEDGYVPDVSGVHHGRGLLPYRLKRVGDMDVLTAGAVRPRSLALQAIVVAVIAAPFILHGMGRSSPVTLWAGFGFVAVYLISMGAVHVIRLPARPILRIDHADGILEQDRTRIPIERIRAVHLARYSVRTGNNVVVGLRRLAIEHGEHGGRAFEVVPVRAANIDEVAESLAAVLSVPLHSREVGELHSEGGFRAW